MLDIWNGNSSWRGNRYLEILIIELTKIIPANDLPYNDYFEYFGPDFKLHIQPK